MLPRSLIQFPKRYSLGILPVQHQRWRFGSSLLLHFHPTSPKGLAWEGCIKSHCTVVTRCLSLPGISQLIRLCNLNSLVVTFKAEVWSEWKNLLLQSINNWELSIPNINVVTSGCCAHPGYFLNCTCVASN